MSKSPFVKFPKNKYGQIKLIPCWCGCESLRVEFNAVTCNNCGFTTSVGFRAQRGGKSYRHQWNKRVLDKLWLEDKEKFNEIYGSKE
jgi:hypothetical protein